MGSGRADARGFDTPSSPWRSAPGSPPHRSRASHGLTPRGRTRHPARPSTPARPTRTPPHPPPAVRTPRPTRLLRSRRTTPRRTRRSPRSAIGTPTSTPVRPTNPTALITPWPNALRVAMKRRSSRNPSVARRLDRLRARIDHTPRDDDSTEATPPTRHLTVVRTGKAEPAAAMAPTVAEVDVPVAAVTPLQPQPLSPLGKLLQLPGHLVNTVLQIFDITRSSQGPAAPIKIAPPINDLLFAAFREVERWIGLDRTPRRNRRSRRSPTRVPPPRKPRRWRSSSTRRRPRTVSGPHLAAWFRSLSTAFRWRRRTSCRAWQPGCG